MKEPKCDGLPYFQCSNSFLLGSVVTSQVHMLSLEDRMSLWWYTYPYDSFQRFLCVYVFAWMYCKWGALVDALPVLFSHHEHVTIRWMSDVMALHYVPILYGSHFCLLVTTRETARGLLCYFDCGALRWPDKACSNSILFCGVGFACICAELNQSLLPFAFA